MDHIGDQAPLRGYTPKLSNPIIFNRPFLKIWSSDFSIVGEYFMQIWARSDEWKLRTSSHGFDGLRYGGQSTPATRELDIQFLLAIVCTANGGKNSDPGKPKVGDFWGSLPNLGAHSPSPNWGGGKNTGVARSNWMRTTQENFVKF